MGQKVNPIGLRLGIIRGWDSNWYGGKNFADKLVEDEKIRKYVAARIPKGAISKVIIERTLKRITLTINTARPGVVIGKGGQEVDKIKEELNVLERRAERIKKLQSLFKGSGFVKYVSGIFLEDLCRSANQRFHKLTKQTLQLELDEDNSFIVRDLMNDGKTRSIKTLSGGQMFQASLSLALSLADNINRQSHARGNFFFLDEGFGSLDKESLREVFDTLKQLRHENRHVGLISHVEEMQQEIDVYVEVRKDDERGSLVRPNWE